MQGRSRLVTAPVTGCTGGLTDEEGRRRLMMHRGCRPLACCRLLANDAVLCCYLVVGCVVDRDDC
jgi:hypothetical protein